MKKISMSSKATLLTQRHLLCRDGEKKNERAFKGLCTAMEGTQRVQLDLQIKKSCLWAVWCMETYNSLKALPSKGDVPLHNINKFPPVYGIVNP